MSAALALLPHDHRTHAEETLIAQTAVDLEARHAYDLADALRTCRVRLHPWRARRERYRHGLAQYQVTLEAPPEAWSRLTDEAGEADRLLRSAFASTMSPLRFVRSLEVVPQD